jgi:hypothetical protein
MNLNIEFERELLKVVMKEVRETFTKEELAILKKNSWGYKYSDSDTIEFHINKCSVVPEGYYWYGSGSSVTYAKAKGWGYFLDKRRDHEKNHR